MKASKVLLCSKNPVSGVSGGQENRLDVTNLTRKDFFKFEKSPRCVGLVQASILNEKERRIPFLSVISYSDVIARRFFFLSFMKCISTIRK